MDKIRFGIVGCGQISQIGHIPNLLQVEGAAITAISDISDENIKAAREKLPSVKGFTDYQDLLRQDDVDVVVVATPNWLHAEQVVAALEAGKDVFCEKPLGISVVECQRIIDAEKTSGGYLQVGHELRHAKVYETAKEKVDSGVIGEVKLLRYTEFRKPLLPGWRQTGRTGGVMLEKNSHFFDLFNWFADSTFTKVIASGANDVNKDSPLIDNCFVNIEYANGVKAHLTMCLFCEKGDRNGLEIVGSKGMLRIADETLEMFTREDGETVTLDCSVNPVEGMHMGCRNQFVSLIENLKTGSKSLNDSTSALQTLKLSIVTEEAIKGGMTC